MSRYRTIKPEFWTSEQVVSCSRDARLMFIGIWNFADDFGVHPYAPLKLKMEVFPADPDIDAPRIEELLAELVKSGLLAVFSAEGRRWLLVTGWRHQKIDRPQRRFPVPPANLYAANADGLNSGAVPEASVPEAGAVPAVRPSASPVPSGEIAPSVHRVIDEGPPIDRRGLGECSSNDRRGLALEGKGKERKGIEGSGDSETPRAISYGELAERARSAARLDFDINRHSANCTAAQGWLGMGAKVEECLEIVRHRASRPDYKPPQSLKFFTPVIEEAVNARKAIEAAGPQAADDPIQREADREASQREARLRGWRKTGLWMTSWGPEPPAEERLKTG